MESDSSYKRKRRSKEKKSRGEKKSKNSYTPPNELELSAPACRDDSNLDKSDAETTKNAVAKDRNQGVCQKDATNLRREIQEREIGEKEKTCAHCLDS